MADNINPTGNSGLSANLLPKFYQTSANKKFLQSTIDQLFQPGSIKKVTGYIGRENAKAATGKDLYVTASDSVRQDYQLEPGITISDHFGNVTFFKDYIDYINQVKVFGGNTSNHQRLNNQEFYSWDPHIDWDKFVNFQNYYWMPYGPDVINIHGQGIGITSTYTVDLTLAGNDNAFLFTPDGLSLNPSLKLYKGHTYKFVINSPGNPFSFKTTRSPGSANRYVIDGIDNYAVESGTITFTIPNDAPSLLYYQSETDVNVSGIIEVYAVTDATYLDVELEILGKQSYILTDGTALSNGMLISFGGNVTPAAYATGNYYVEGVGTAIKLIPSNILEVVTPYTISEDIQFDNLPFDNAPFDGATSYASLPDYITINRASIDHNPWSRYNRWIHKDVITASLAYNNNTITLDQTVRANRPIIEFQPDLKLFNLGSKAIPDVDLIDDYTTDVFSTIEGSTGYNIDGINLVSGFRIIFTADTDPLVTNKVFQVEFITINGVNQIHLVEQETPELNNVTMVKNGKKKQSLTYWYDGSTWVKGQQKTSVNQSPLFDIVDDNGISYGDTTTYNGSTFTGTSIFTYKVATGVNDSVLGFPLSYKNVSNIGDIVFNFTLATDSFEYKKVSAVIEQPINVGYLVGHDYSGNVVYSNGWQTAKVSTVQAAIRIYNDAQTNNFNIDIFDDIQNLDDLVVRVYVNGVRLSSTAWTLVQGVIYYQVVLTTPIAATDILTIRAFAKQPINNNGYYEIPINLQNNPLNESIGDFTLGEVSDHLNSILDNTTAFVGVFPGDGNIRDLGNITPYGTKFVQHSGPLSLGIYHMTSETNNIVSAIERSREDYNNFKRTFLTIAESLGVDADPAIMVELILQKMNINKPKTSPYYFSDMVPYGAKVTADLAVVDYRVKTYPLSTPFTLTTLSNKAVGVYLNGSQLLHEKDYTFDSQGFINVTATIANGDTITIYEYDNTDGCFMPSTPTKLGLWPKFEPMLYLDTTLVTPRWMIQGHDGSQVLAYGTYGDSGTADYRDGLILELEKRIYNNIKVQYDTDIFDIADIIPGFNRETDYSLTEFNTVLSPNFYKWTGLAGVDFTKPLSYDRANTFTFNYSENYAPDGSALPGYWRGVYRWLLDTDRPHLCPWEMLGFSSQPTWWTTTYGPAPWTSDNLLMWNDLANGVVREPNMPAVKRSNYVRPILSTFIPVDSQGNLVSPLLSGMAQGPGLQSVNNNFVFGDVSPVENAWRRSSYYPFSVLITSMILTPAKTFGLALDRSRIVRNLAGQLVYADTKLRITPSSIVLPSIPASTTRTQTAGIVNYIVDYIMNYIFSNNVVSYNGYVNDLQSLTPQLSYRLGAFTNKTQFNLLLESKTPLSSGNVFIPQENFTVFLNKSSSLQKLTYSGVIITKLSTGFEIKGYSNTAPYFNYYGYLQNGSVLNVGGISASFVTWTAGSFYSAGEIVKNGNAYYSVKISHTATDITAEFYSKLPSLPIVGGVNVQMRTEWDRNNVLNAPYGITFNTAQEVYDFIIGYSEYLKDQGFVFDTFNSNLNTVSNWETSAKEFLFWTTQNWSTGQEKWSDWTEGEAVAYGTIVRYNGDYYSAAFNVPASDVFDAEKYNKLDGLSNVGSSVISLSPLSNGVTFNTNLTVVDDISNPFNSYEIFRVDGTPIKPADLNSYREGNTVYYSTSNGDGIYGASFYLIQNEHVITISNNTIFNDTIYSPATGYRQERLKVSGYVTTDWYGGLDIPGFVFDAAVVQSWTPWADYNTGDIVSFQGFYYGANSFIPGAAEFTASQWNKLSGRPSSEILPNWTNLATQFTEFYDLNTDSFDPAQQTMAQHLIGYQKRQYLENIIQDDVSEYKFYQGMIRDKGTQNVLNKLFNPLNADVEESLVFYEEWALRVGQYGATNLFENIEFILDEGKFRSNPQGFSLTENIDPNLSSFIIQQTANDVYLKPIGYDSNPFPEITNYNSFLRSAGYVNPADVFASVGYLTDVLTYDITTFTSGDYVWCAFEKPPTNWNIYKFLNTSVEVSAVTYVSNVLTLTVTTPASYNAGDIIGISGGTILDGFYTVTTNNGTDTITINTTAITNFPQSFTQSSSLVLSVFVSQRVPSIDSLDNIVNSTAGDLLWTDDNGTGIWSVWEYSPTYTAGQLNNVDTRSLYQYGATLGINLDTTLSAINNLSGQIATFEKASISLPWNNRQIIQAPFIAHLEGSDVNASNYIPSAIAFSPDNVWMAVGLPLATHVSTATSNGYYTPVSTGGTNSSLTHQGMISLYKKDVNNIFTLVDSIVSPSPIANELFGTSLVFADNKLYIGAPGSNKVYTMVYATTTHATTSYNPVGSSGATLVVSSNSGIAVGMAVVGNGFDGTQLVTGISGKVLTLSGVPTDTPSNTLSFITTQWQYNSQTYTGSSSFGTAITISKDQQTLLIGSSSSVYAYLGTSTTSSHTFTGTSFDISDTGEYIVIGNGTTVKVFQNSTSGYILYQTLIGKHLDVSNDFGNKVNFMNDYKTLIIYNKGTSGGVVEAYDNYFTKWVYSETIATTSVTTGAYGIAVGSNQVLITDIKGSQQTGTLKTAQKTPGTVSWKIRHEQAPIPDVSRIKKAFLYNKDLGKIVTYLDVIDPAQGKIPGIADEEIKYKTFYDPATYSMGDSGTVNVNSTAYWSKDQVGSLWWDLRTSKFVNGYFDDPVYRTNVWNTLAKGASVDIYEWVESTLLPAAWDAQADTPAGVANGISGTSLYGNTSYSVRQRYDNISKTFKNTYYFWVKNKNIVPTISSRHISAQQVSNLISNPRGQGYVSLTLTGINSFSLTNVKQYLSDSSVVLSIEYWLSDNTTQNLHSQWKLISNDPIVNIPTTIEQKWFDSLCGVDSQGRSVPDMRQPVKLRYGIENRPRQSMFVNRIEALKEFIESVNNTLIDVQVSENYDITPLHSYDAAPLASTGLYDIVLDTDADLSLINASSYNAPVLQAVVSADGAVIGVEILSAGKGYVNAPPVIVLGEGIGASLQSVINASGQIVSVTVVNGGQGYLQSTTSLSVRSYSALVKSDSNANGNWGIYSYTASTTVWSRVLTQSYNVTTFWNYADWYATGYSQFSAPDHAVPTFVELNALTAYVGELVKVLVANNGGWMLLYKYADSTSFDWTQSYSVVGIQNGTIQFSTALYEFAATAIGYDASTYDGEVYDIVASTELRIILNTIKNNIFIGALKQNYLDLFLASVRYAHSEQVYLDWAFKTSFVRATHIVGDLGQPVNYPVDNLSNFEDYIAEVKPYRTQIREYISNYTKLDVGQAAVTDFDVPPIYENGQVTLIDGYLQDGQVAIYDPAIQNYPWKFWLDNVGFSVTEIRLIDGGSGYTSAPTVTINSESGTGAVVKAYVANGRVNRLILESSGSGYLTAPTVTFTGGLGSGGTAARAAVVIGDSLVRSNLIKMKFDRVTQTYFVTDLNQVETLSSSLVNGTRTQFPLTWAPDIRIGKTTVTVDGILVLRDTYKLSIVTSTTLGYTSYSGSITFDTAPTGTVIVSYVKDISLLSAADRIQYYYDPVSGQIGKNLSQLMTGIDYGGVQVNGLDFNITGGWGNKPYATEGWDLYDKTFTDYIATTSAGQHSFTLNYTPANGTEMNFYYVHAGTTIRLDDPNYGTDAQTNANAIMLPVTANGNTNVFTIPSGFTVNAGDTIIIRQSTSDGSIKPQAGDYDTVISGGDMAYTSALGVDPAELIIDGDGFVTPTSSPAPEEVVPGQVVDAVAIKVFDRPSSGAANVKIDSYRSDGVTNTWKMTQQPNSPQAVIVKVGNTVLTPTTDFTVDYRNRAVILANIPALNVLISIFSISFSGKNILDFDSFVGDGITTEFVTHATWLSSFNSVVYVDGSIVTPVTFKTDDSYDLANVVGIRFASAPAAGQLITYMIVSGNQQTFTINRTETVSADGSLTYTLQYPIGKSLMNESNMIVRVDQTILRAPISQYYTIGSNRLSYTVDSAKIQPYTMQATDIVVLADGNPLTLGIDFTVDLSGLTIKINKTIYRTYSGKQLTISVTTHDGYSYNAATGQITFKQAYTSENNVQIFGAYTHDTLDIQRTEITALTSVTLGTDSPAYYAYKTIFGGLITLDRPVIDDNYVWIVKNGTLLVPSVDYKLLDNRETVQLAVSATDQDVFSLITFGSNVLPVGIAYMQFKDMLNRTTYKRLNANKQTRLTRDLYYNDTVIEVEDASAFGLPNAAANRPGVIEIRGERIEYFSVVGNTFAQLRRGTMGTGTPARHKATSYVQDIGGVETIPYFDTTVTKQFTADGSSQIVTLDYIPGSVDEIEIFVGGYDDVTIWEPNVAYEINKIVRVGTYTYKCVTAHTSSTTFTLDSDNWTFFIGNIRLKKHPYNVFNENLNPDSPAGDVTLPADFTLVLDGSGNPTNQITLTNLLTAGTTITVVKRTGMAWDSSLNIQYDDTNIARFLKDQPGTWYTDARQYGTSTPVTFDSTIYTFDSTAYTFDKE